jgi:hypothetical protein
MRALLQIASLGCIMVGSSAAAEPTVTYSFVEVATQRLMRIDYYATFNLSCAPAPAPIISVVQNPKFGALIIRPGGLITKKVLACPVIKTPVLVVYYRSRIGYTGADHIVYSVTSRNGVVTIYDVNISVKGNAESIHSMVTGDPV